MSVNIYQSILRDLSSLSEFQLEKVATFIKKMSKPEESLTSAPDSPQEAVAHFVNEVSLETLRAKNKELIGALSPWPESDFKEFTTEIENGRLESETERDLKW